MSPVDDQGNEVVDLSDAYYAQVTAEDNLRSSGAPFPAADTDDDEPPVATRQPGIQGEPVVFYNRNSLDVLLPSGQTVGIAGLDVRNKQGIREELGRTSDPTIRQALNAALIADAATIPSRNEYFFGTDTPQGVGGIGSRASSGSSIASSSLTEEELSKLFAPMQSGMQRMPDTLTGMQRIPDALRPFADAEGRIRLEDALAANVQPALLGQYGFSGEQISTAAGNLETRRYLERQGNQQLGEYVEAKNAFEATHTQTASGEWVNNAAFEGPDALSAADQVLLLSVGVTRFNEQKAADKAVFEAAHTQTRTGEWIPNDQLPQSPEDRARLIEIGASAYDAQAAAGRQAALQTLDRYRESHGLDAAGNQMYGYRLRDAIAEQGINVVRDAGFTQESIDQAVQSGISALAQRATVFRTTEASAKVLAPFVTAGQPDIAQALASGVSRDVLRNARYSDKAIDETITYIDGLSDRQKAVLATSGSDAFDTTGLTPAQIVAKQKAVGLIDANVLYAGTGDDGKPLVIQAAPGLSTPDADLVRQNGVQYRERNEVSPQRAALLADTETLLAGPVLQYDAVPDTYVYNGGLWKIEPDGSVAYLGQPESKARELLAFVPVVGTVAFFKERSPLENAISIASDAIAAGLLVAGGVGAARGLARVAGPKPALVPVSLGDDALRTIAGRDSIIEPTVGGATITTLGDTAGDLAKLSYAKAVNTRGVAEQGLAIAERQVVQTNNALALAADRGEGLPMLTQLGNKADDAAAAVKNAEHGLEEAKLAEIRIASKAVPILAREAQEAIPALTGGGGGGESIVPGIGSSTRPPIAQYNDVAFGQLRTVQQSVLASQGIVASSDTALAVARAELAAAQNQLALARTTGNFAIISNAKAGVDAANARIININGYRASQLLTDIGKLIDERAPQSKIDAAKAEYTQVIRDLEVYAVPKSGSDMGGSARPSPEVRPPTPPTDFSGGSRSPSSLQVLEARNPAIIETRLENGVYYPILPTNLDVGDVVLMGTGTQYAGLRGLIVRLPDSGYPEIQLETGTVVSLAPTRVKEPFKWPFEPLFPAQPFPMPSPRPVVWPEPSIVEPLVPASPTPGPVPSLPNRPPPVEPDRPSRISPIHAPIPVDVPDVVPNVVMTPLVVPTPDIAIEPVEVPQRGTTPPDRDPLITTFPQDPVPTEFPERDRQRDPFIIPILPQPPDKVPETPGNLEAVTTILQQQEMQSGQDPAQTPASSPATGTNLGQGTGPDPALITRVDLELLRQTATATDITTTTTTDVPDVKTRGRTRVRPPPFLPPEPKLSKVVRSGLPVVVWPQGPIWVSIAQPYRQANVLYGLAKPPRGIVVKGPRQAWNTIRKLTSGSAPAVDTYDEFASWAAAQGEDRRR